MSNTASFLPEDYLAQKAERRTNIISLVLFAVVMLGVFAAFLLTNQKWSQIKTEQESINVRYQTAATQIRELTELEEQKDEMLQKAELAAALVERVPRSILLAEIINRMPDRLSLLEFDLTSEKIKAMVPRPQANGATTGRISPTRARTREEAAEEKSKVRPPTYRVAISMVGVAPGDLEVSRYLAELNAYALFKDVTLEYTEEKEVEGRTMRQFSINMRLDPGADMRDVEPLIMPRSVRDPMSNMIRYPAPEAPAEQITAGENQRPEGD